MIRTLVVLRSPNGLTSQYFEFSTTEEHDRIVGTISLTYDKSGIAVDVIEFDKEVIDEDHENRINDRYDRYGDGKSR